MRFNKITLATGLAALATAVTAIDTIVVKDRHFYTSKGEPFFIKGVDYQPGGSAEVGKSKWDPLSDPDVCARDIALFQRLGVNTIRVYSVDTTLNHDECMTMLAAAGIYLVLDVNSPLTHQHMHPTQPWTTYTPMYLEHVFTVMEQFSGYDNVLAFLSGNEVIHDKGSEKTAPQYIKAINRDMRAYMEKHLPRNIPIGYSNADHIEFRVSLANFMQCGEEGYVDFFGVNSYQWCGENTFKGSGYDSLVEAYSNYSLPVFFSEFGCNEVRPRLWQEVDALYSDKMTGVFSGGLVYEFTQEEADYGIVQLSQSEAGKGDAQILEEFDPLAKAFKRADPKIPSGLEIVPRSEKCGKPSDYPGIVANNTLPATLGADLIKKGVDSDKFTRGKFIDASKLTTKSSYKVKDYDGKAVDASVDKTTDVTPGQHSKDDDSAASSKQVMIGSSILAAATALFFSF
jgi:hypothetical protein